MICLTKERIIFDLTLSDFEDFKTFLKIKKVKFKEKQLLSQISHIGIGGEFPLLILPESTDELVGVLSYLVNYNIDFKLVGRMTNILPMDDNYGGVIVKTDDINRFYRNGEVLSAECGCSLPKLALSACSFGLGGLEALSGIPGSVGAGVCGNAGAFGKEISDIFLSARLYSPTKDEFYTVVYGDMDFKYRSSAYLGGDTVLLTADFALTPTPSDVIKLNMDKYRSERILKQPCGYRTLGSVFKRPLGDYASRMIDECGLRGYRIGGARISPKHAGFIENIGGATAKDYKELVELSRAKVLSKFGVLLDLENEIW